MKEVIFIYLTYNYFKGRQAVEAQRDDCTVLVLRIHIDAVEKDVFKLFAANNLGRVIDIKIIRDQRSGKSKGVAYVEFESQESVLLAVALTNQQILGNILTRFTIIGVKVNIVKYSYPRIYLNIKKIVKLINHELLNFSLNIFF